MSVSVRVALGRVSHNVGDVAVVSVSVIARVKWRSV